MRSYDRIAGFRPGAPEPAPGWFSGGYGGETPMYGWGWWGSAFGWPQYTTVDAPRGPDWHTTPPPDDPRESPAYGRGGDLAARRWAARYGYDVEMTIQPRGAYGGRRVGYGTDYRPYRSGSPRWARGYDSGWGRDARSDAGYPSRRYDSAQGLGYWGSRRRR